MADATRVLRKAVGILFLLVHTSQLTKSCTAYYLPSDVEELSRLDQQHVCVRPVLDGRLHLAPIVSRKSADAFSVLDVGTGTGIWAKEFALAHSNASVTGVDLNTVDDQGFPSNCSFQIGDMEADWSTWAKEQKYDFIHARILLAAVHDARRFVEQAVTHLKPGGWFEWQDILLEMSCACPGVYDINKCPHQKMRDWCDEMHEVSLKVGMNTKRAGNFSPAFDASNLVHVSGALKRLYIGPWSQDEGARRLGVLWRRNLVEGLMVSAIRFLPKLWVGIRRRSTSTSLRRRKSS
jgi:SAM-dependent methyltransferase